MRQLNAAGLRATPQRLATWAAVVEGPAHASIHEIYDRVVAVVPPVTLRTVYDAVHLLEKLSLVRLLHVPGGARVELEPVRHGHG